MTTTSKVREGETVALFGLEMYDGSKGAIRSGLFRLIEFVPAEWGHAPAWLVVPADTDPENDEAEFLVVDEWELVQQADPDWAAADLRAERDNALRAEDNDRWMEEHQC